MTNEIIYIAFLMKRQKGFIFTKIYFSKNKTDWLVRRFCDENLFIVFHIDNCVNA